jgi:hypothetical protein
MIGTIDVRVIAVNTGEIIIMIAITPIQNTDALTNIDTLIESPSCII